MRNIVNKNEAVSPVVGVMLMLVVTIIIAAVVSGFAGGLAGGTEKAPQASIVASEVVVNEAYDSLKTVVATGGSDWNANPVAGKCSDAYVVFEHMGGDGINLNNIEINLGSLKYPAEKSVITNAKTPNEDTAVTGDKADIESGFSNDWSIYIEGYPDHESLISPGSKFVLHADYVREGIETRADHSSAESFKKISWSPDGASGAFSIDAGDYLTYDIIDKNSKKSIASGQIQVRDFSVASS